MKKARIITLVTAAMIADDRANKPNVDAAFSCPEFKVNEAWLQEKDGQITRRHLVVKTPSGVRYIGVAEALDAGMLQESNGGYEALTGYQLSFDQGVAQVTA